MKEYIVNLTNNLIGKYCFDNVFESMKAENPSGHTQQFFNLVYLTISADAVRDMSPETLGKIVCSIEGNEVPHIFPANYTGNPDGHLRLTVSKLLAWSILYRFDGVALKRHDQIPPYVSKRANTSLVSPHFRKLVDNLVQERNPKS